MIFDKNGNYIPDGCHHCKYFEKDLKCKAFPKGVLLDILNGDRAHIKPIEGQVGSFVFSPIKK